MHTHPQDARAGLRALLAAARTGRLPDADAALALEGASAQALLPAAQALTLEGFGRVVTYSRKVFIPLTQLCRDVCHYCTFAKTPRHLAQPYLSLDQVLKIARAGAAAGCREALFTLGDQPEARYPAARRALGALGFATTLEYLAHCAQAVHAETGLLPHLNPGLMQPADLARLRPLAVSMGLMLESGSARLSARGGPHFGSPDKLPAARLATLRAAGELAVPMTTGLLIGIGETRRERIESLLALRELHARHGHLQEIIIQNFRAKPGTRMAHAPEPTLEEHQWTLAVTRLIFGAAMSLQAPPNLQPQALTALIRAGVNDWGGVSPVTPDHVNPEAPWPHLAGLAQATRAAGRTLTERLALTPRFVQRVADWVDPALRTAVLRLADASGRARTDDWYAGAGTPVPRAFAQPRRRGARTGAALAALLGRATRGEELAEGELAALFALEGAPMLAVLRAADELRAAHCGDEVSYVVNRNINYTNICLYHCGFCDFSKGRSARSLRGPAYRLDLPEIARRTQEAWAAGATEVCLQGGIHPDYTGDTYLAIVAAVKSACPDMHVHAFSPLEITHGARTLGLRSTATIMFGHVDAPIHWARHLLSVRALQRETGGFTEFVPLPFVHMEAPLWRKGLARSGPTLRESLLMHALARLCLHPHITNIQTSWVKMGPEGAALALRSGANDLGGTLMNESITRAAGGVNGQEFDAQRIIGLAAGVGRPA